MKKSGWKKAKGLFADRRKNRKALKLRMSEYGIISHKKQSLFFVCMMSGMSVLLGMAFQLKPGTIAVMAVLIWLFTPGMIFDLHRYQYEKCRFMDVSIYMEQILYAFQGGGKILTALQDVRVLFPEGTMRYVIDHAISDIQGRSAPGDPERAGLYRIEKKYPCRLLKSIHAFMLHAEQIGGDFSRSQALLLQERSMWHKRTERLIKEKKKYQRDILISIALSVGICILGLHLLPRGADITGFFLYQVSTVAMIICDLMIYRGMMRRMGENMLDAAEDEEYIRKKYRDYTSYEEKTGRRTSFKMSLIPAAAAVYGGVTGQKWILTAGIILACMILFQHKLGHYLAYKTVQKALRRAFPEWLIQMSLLLQTENVQMAIRRSKGRAPEILRPELQKLIYGMEEDPESERPYLEFLSEYHLNDVPAAMRMLYAVSSGSGGNPQQQISELIHRSQQIHDQEKRASDDDSLAGLYTRFLLPSVTGMLKLTADMTMFMMVYFSSLNTMH